MCWPWNVALDRPRAARRAGAVSSLRFFGGLTIDEAAGVLDISPATAKRDG